MGSPDGGSQYGGWLPSARKDIRMEATVAPLLISEVNLVASAASRSIEMSHHIPIQDRRFVLFGGRE